MVATNWLTIIVNVVAIFSAIYAVGRWVRHWIKKTVSDPIADLKRSMTDVKDLAIRAHERLDRHLETHNG